MSTFKWVIHDASDDVASVFQGGSVDLEDAKVTTTLPQWQVQPPDGTAALVPQLGGEVELAEKPRPLSSLISPTVLNFVLAFLAIVVGFVIMLNAWRGNVISDKLLYPLAPFIAGFIAGRQRQTG